MEPNGKRVMDMQLFYRTIAFGIILFYVAIVLTIFRLIRRSKFWL
jgi:hypothetical protein